MFQGNYIMAQSDQLGKSPRARFLGGTLVLEEVPRTARPPASFQWINAKWRCPAVQLLIKKTPDS